MARQICARRKIKLNFERLNIDPPAVCDSALVQAVSCVCRELNISAKKLISRAYHDSLFMARVCPVTMIFIPCRKGFSHRPDEYSSPAQIEKGTCVLAQALAVASLS
jgi:ureidoglycolate amidohydrolase